MAVALDRWLKLGAGFSGTCRDGRNGCGLVLTLLDGSQRAVTLLVPGPILRLIDELVVRLRREEHEALLLTTNHGWLGWTLCEAAEAGGLQDIAFLLAHGAQLEFEHENKTPVEKAAVNGQAAAVRALLQAGAREGGYALVRASKGGHLDAVGVLLERVTTYQTAYLDMAIRHAADGGFREVVQALLGAGARNLVLALQWACGSGHLDVARVLLEHVTEREYALDRALVEAAAEGQLLGWGATRREDALRAARREGHEAVVSLLLEHAERI